MTITAVTQKTIATATTTTAVVTLNTLLGHTPAVGNLVVVEIDRATDSGVDTEPSGDWQTGAAVGGTATVGGHCGCYYRQIDGTEAGTYTWSFASSSRKVVVYEFNDSVPGKLWVPDTPNIVTFLGTNTSTNSQALGPTGTLNASDEVAVAALVLSAAPGTVTPTISGFTVPFGTNTTQIQGYAVLGANTALNPTVAWTTAHAKAAGLIVPFMSVAPGNMFEMF